MEAPNHDAGNARTLGLERDQIANACLVEASVVVDDENLSRRSGLKGFKENVHAPDVARRSRPTCALHTRRNRPQADWSTSDGNASPQAGVGQMCGAKMAQPFNERCIHRILLRSLIRRSA